MRIGLFLTFLFVGSTIAGCLGPGSDVQHDTATTDLVPVAQRYLQDYDTADFFSRTVTDGLYEILEPVLIDLPVDLPIDQGGAAATGDAIINMGLWLPDVPAGTKVPVVADVGPYYLDGDGPANEPGARLGRHLIENLVPQGYAVAQVSVFGTGWSNHCMDLMGLSEQLGIDAAVTYLGTQDWSNGNVGLIGRSYDGSTPWEAAMFGNEHLKTIVPISGLTGAHELMWRNGTAEFRGPIMHNGVYGFFGIDSLNGGLGNVPPNPDNTANEADTDDADTLCRGYMTGPGAGLGAFLTGDHFAPEANDYWSQRYFFDRAIDNHVGSIYYIHGMQDWNVDPHMAFPYYQRAVDAGFEIKGLFGQWNHMYPDRPTEHIAIPRGEGEEAFPESVRFDWAQDLLEWFDHYLKGTGPKPELHAEIQDNQGTWRIEPTWPPQDATWTLMSLSDFAHVAGDGKILPEAENYDLTGSIPSNDDTEVYTIAGFETETRIAGSPRFHVQLTPTGEGGTIYAELRDKTDDLRLGHAIMDIRFAAGGSTMGTVTPGMPVTALMEFEPLDVVIPAGHELELRLASTGRDYWPAPTDSVLVIGQGLLKLPVIERDGTTFFTPPAWDPCTHADLARSLVNGDYEVPENRQGRFEEVAKICGDSYDPGVIAKAADEAADASA